MMINHLRKVALACVSLMMMGVSAFAQQQVSGTVRDAKGEPVIGAGIVVEGTQNGVVTDIDGRWTLSVPSNSTLVASCIGYTDVKVKVSAGQSVYDITLEESSLYLDDVVVIGYQTVKRRDLTGSVSSVNSKQLSSTRGAKVAQSFQGELAGVSVFF